MNTNNNTTDIPLLLQQLIIQYNLIFPITANNTNNKLIVSSAPGRVNIIGEHTDYNDGFVFPMCIQRSTYCIGRLNGLNECRFISINEAISKLPINRTNNGDNHTDSNTDSARKRKQQMIDDSNTDNIDLSTIIDTEPTAIPSIDNNLLIQSIITISNNSLSSSISSNNSWLNYVIGTILCYFERTNRSIANDILGVDLLFYGTVPLGGGLSSSASLEVAVSYWFDELYSSRNNTNKLDVVTHALLCQRAENQYCNVPCGLMDQFISSAGRSNTIMLLDCRPPHLYKLIPFTNTNLSILITNSNIKHSLSNSEYSVRRAECNKAVEIINQYYPTIKSLRDCTIEQLVAIRQHFTNEIIFNRAQHVITEINRTETASSYLINNNYSGLGSLMIYSHISLKNDYCVSCNELDILVSLALQFTADNTDNTTGIVYGSRMTGGGFGGSTVTLLDSIAIEKVTKYIYKNYFNQVGIYPTFIVTTPAQGARIYNL